MRYIIIATIVILVSFGGAAYVSAQEVTPEPTVHPESSPTASSEPSPQATPVATLEPTPAAAAEKSDSQSANETTENTAAEADNTGGDDIEAQKEEVLGDTDVLGATSAAREIFKWMLAGMVAVAVIVAGYKIARMPVEEE